MIFGKTKVELKVGVFVLIGLVILIMFVLSIGSFKTWTSGYRLNFIFHFVNGVKLGAPVRFAGVDIGVVKNLKFFFDPKEAQTKVKIVCWLKREVNVPVDSTVWVNTLGLLGEKYIEVIPGKDYKHILEENMELSGKDPIPMNEIGELAKRIANNLDEAINKINNKEGTLGKLLGDDTIYNELEAALKNKDGTIGRLFYDDSLYKDMEALIEDIRRHPWKLFWKTKEEPAGKK